MLSFRGMHLGWWSLPSSESGNSDIDAADEAADVDETACWPEPVVPALSQPVFDPPHGLRSQELSLLRAAHESNVLLFNE